MKRKWRIGRVVLAATLIFVASMILLWWWPRPPFRFLGWNTPVRVDTSPSGELQQDHWTYAFRADFDELRGRVESELFPLGFVAVADDRRLGYRAVQYERRSDGVLSYGSVLLFQNMRYRLPQYGEPYAAVGYDEAGWVSFGIRLERPPDFADRCRTTLQKWWESLRLPSVQDK